MKQFKTTIRLSWDDLDLLTAYQTAKNIPVRTEAIMQAVKEACAREKITAAILPETMRASYMLTRPEEKPIETPIQEEENHEEEEETSGTWPCPHERLILKKQKTIDDCRVCPSGEVDTCKNIEEWARKELIAERAGLELAHKEESEETEKKGSEKPDKKPISTEPSVTKETPKVQPEIIKNSETVENPDIEAQQAAQIKAIRERLEKKPKGQQKLGAERENENL
jgi:hypothetical protein